MKAKNILSILLCCMAALSMTACLDDDNDNNGPTIEQQRAAYQAVQGNYTGKLIYEKASYTGANDRTDTLDVNWLINTDSVFYVNNFPAAAVAEHIQNAELKAAIAAQPAQRIKCVYGLYNVSPIAFLVNPGSLTYNVSYNGGTHEVTIAFYVNSTYSYGAFDSSTKTMELQFIPGGVYVDKVLNNTLITEMHGIHLVAKQQ